MQPFSQLVRGGSFSRELEQFAQGHTAGVEPWQAGSTAGPSPGVSHHLSTCLITGSLGHTGTMEGKILSFLPVREARRSNKADRSILKLSLQTDL